MAALVIKLVWGHMNLSVIVLQTSQGLDHNSILVELLLMSATLLSDTPDNP